MQVIKYIYVYLDEPGNLKTKLLQIEHTKKHEQKNKYVDIPLNPGSLIGFLLMVVLKSPYDWVVTNIIP